MPWSINIYVRLICRVCLVVIEKYLGGYYYDRIETVDF